MQIGWHIADFDATTSWLYERWYEAEETLDEVDASRATRSTPREQRRKGEDDDATMMLR